MLHVCATSAALCFSFGIPDVLLLSPLFHLAHLCRLHVLRNRTSLRRYREHLLSKVRRAGSRPIPLRPHPSCRVTYAENSAFRHPWWRSSPALKLHTAQPSSRALDVVRPVQCPFDLGWDDKAVWSQSPGPPLVTAGKIWRGHSGGGQTSNHIASNLPVWQGAVVGELWAKVFALKLLFEIIKCVCLNIHTDGNRQLCGLNLSLWCENWW